MTIRLIIPAFLLLYSCAGKKNSQNDVIIDSLKQSINSGVNNEVIIDSLKQPIDSNVNNAVNKDILHELREEYQNYEKGYDNDLNYLGLGVVNPKRFDFSFITDTTVGTKFDIEDIENQEYLIPVFRKHGYGIFFMPVVNISNKYYEVRVNTKNNVFVNKNDFNFYTWEELFVKEALSVRTQNGYYLRRDVESENIIYDYFNDKDDVFLTVEKYNGDWLLVNETNDENDFVKKHVKKHSGDSLLVNETLKDGSKKNTYWIKWRDGNKLLASPVFLM